MTRVSRVCGTNNVMMNWIELTSPHQLDEIKKESEMNHVLIFKHSTRCATSKLSLDRLERNWTAERTAVKPYFLDLLNYRSVSNLVAETFDVEHESPQVLLIHKGQSILDLSHYAIDYDPISRAIRN